MVKTFLYPCRIYGYTVGDIHLKHRIMKEKYIFIGIVGFAIVAVCAIAYRSLYRTDGMSSYSTQREPNIDQNKQTGHYMAPVTAPAVVAPTTQPGVPPVNVQSNVRYASAGFFPASLTVSAGDAVVFKNESTADMWVASAPHPFHTDYPGFDALRPYKPGESYSFTFTRVGIWKYHNHLNPTHYGSIVVIQ